MHLGLVGFCSFSEEGVRKERKKARFLSAKNSENKRKPLLPKRFLCRMTSPAVLVGSIGLEPTTSTMSTWRSDQLSYDPKHEIQYIVQPGESQPLSPTFLKMLTRSESRMSRLQSLHVSSIIRICMEKGRDRLYEIRKNPPDDDDRSREELREPGQSLSV